MSVSSVRPFLFGACLLSSFQALAWHASKGRKDVAHILLNEYKGVNLAGGENDYTYAGKHLQQWPTNAMLDRWNKLGFKTIRLPFHIIDLQPVANGPLSSSIMMTIDSLIDHARSNGQFIVLDPHDFGANQIGVIGVAPGSSNAFVDFWKRVAIACKKYPNVIFGLMNEPNAQTAAQWKLAATAAIEGIRKITQSAVIAIPGTAFTGAHSWVSSGNAAAWTGWSDPVGGPFMFDMHEYLDSDFSGTHATCANGYSAMTPAIIWARKNGFKIFVGEFAYSQDKSCAIMGPAFVRGMTSDSDVVVGWTWWAAGSEFGSSYIFNLNPNPDGSVQPQVTVLRENLATPLRRNAKP